MRDQNRAPIWRFYAIRFYQIQMSKIIFTSLFMMMSLLANAAPFRPANDAEVIDTLPQGSLTYQTKAQDDALRGQPFSVVEPKITALLTQAYNWGDPRALGQAESLLERYRQDSSPQVRLLRANVYQASHRFDLARQELQGILKQLPDEPESILMLSSIELVQGQFETARQHCNTLNSMSLLILKMACMAQVDSVSGRLKQSAYTIDRLMRLNSGLTAEQQRWLALMLADMALRLNDPVLAKAAFDQLNQYNSAPVLAAKADWLLAHGQWQAVKKLLIHYTDNDALLVRLLVSEQQLNDADFKPHFELMRERIQVWNERGETAHQREAAQYALLFKQPRQALELARLNWKKQRETADVVVYANAAIRNQSKLDIQIIQDWIKQTGFEYPLVNKSLAQAQAGQTK